MSEPEEAQQAHVHPARVEALSRKLDTLREELEEERQQRLEMEQRVADAEQTLEAMGVNEIDGNTPDKRALRVRKWLYEEANESKNGKAAMDKMVAKGVLGDIHREQRYEAMRRAADGNDGARSGSSSLSPVQGIEFQKFDDPDRLSRVRIDLEAMTQVFGRQILTTEETKEGV